MVRKTLICFIMLSIILAKSICSSNKEDKPAWTKKDIRDYNDADLERLYDQWEEDEEPLEPDELPEHLRPAPKIDLTKIDTKNPESILKVSKKGRTLMMFVTVSGKPTKEELETVTGIWQSSLMNNHISAERFVIDENRAIFMFKDGSQAWEAKEFLLEQEKLESVSIENQVFNGKHAKVTNKEEL